MILKYHKYGSEIWGLTPMISIERVHLYACKCFMNATSKTCNAVVLGDCGSHQMFVNTAKPVVKYWLRILKMPDYRYVKHVTICLGFMTKLGIVIGSAY